MSDAAYRPPGLGLRMPHSRNPYLGQHCHEGLCICRRIFTNSTACNQSMPRHPPPSTLVSTSGAAWSQPDIYFSRITASPRSSAIHHSRLGISITLACWTHTRGKLASPPFPLLSTTNFHRPCIPCVSSDSRWNFWSCAASLEVRKRPSHPET